MINLTKNKIFAIALKMLNNGPKFPNYSIPAERWLWKESFHWAQIQEQGLWGDWDSEQNNLDHEGKQNQTLFQAQI